MPFGMFRVALMLAMRACDRGANLVLLLQIPHTPGGDRRRCHRRRCSNPYLQSADPAVIQTKAPDNPELFSEAPTRIELVIRVLQTLALPLGYVAI